MSTADAAARALEAEQTIANGSGPDVIAEALRATFGTQADLARRSGLTTKTLTAIKRGKRPSAAQRSAILWAIFKGRI